MCDWIESGRRWCGLASQSARQIGHVRMGVLPELVDLDFTSPNLGARTKMERDIIWENVFMCKIITRNTFG